MNLMRNEKKSLSMLFAKLDEEIRNQMGSLWNE